MQFGHRIDDREPHAVPDVFVLAQASASAAILARTCSPARKTSLSRRVEPGAVPVLINSPSTT